MARPASPCDTFGSTAATAFLGLVSPMSRTPGAPVGVTATVGASQAGPTGVLARSMAGQCSCAIQARRRSSWVRRPEMAATRRAWSGLAAP